MPFIPPIILIRRNHIVDRLKRSGAVSPKTAKSFSDIGVINPGCFRRVTDILLKRSIIRQTEDGKFYICR